MNDYTKFLSSRACTTCSSARYSGSLGQGVSAGNNADMARAKLSASTGSCCIKVFVQAPSAGSVSHREKILYKDARTSGSRTPAQVPRISSGLLSAFAADTDSVIVNYYMLL